MKAHVAFLQLATLCVALTTCQGKREPPPPRPRIVSLLPNATEILFEIGLGQNLVGATRYCDRPEAAKSVPRVGGVLDVSIEALLAVQPDLVIASPTVLNSPLEKTLARMGIKALPLSFETLDELTQGIIAIGAATGKTEEAKMLALRLQGEIEGLKASALRSPKIRVVFVAGRSPIVVAGPRSFIGELLEIMGVENVVSTSAVAFPTWSVEQVIRAAPDIIVDASVEEGQESEMGFWKSLGSWAAIRPPDPAIIRPGPGSIKAATALAQELLRTLGK